MWENSEATESGIELFQKRTCNPRMSYFIRATMKITKTIQIGKFNGFNSEYMGFQLIFGF